MKTNIKSYLSSRIRELIIKTPFKISKKKKKNLMFGEGGKILHQQKQIPLT